MTNILESLSLVPPAFIYGVIFLFMFVEGEVVLLLAGILARQNHIGFIEVLLVAFAGSILHDMLYWEIGRELAGERGRVLFFFRRRQVKDFLSRFEGKSGMYIFISKFTWGVARLVLISAGYKGYHQREILRYSIPAGLIWSIALVSLGYVFAAETQVLRKDVTTATLLITGALLGVIFLEYLVKRIVKDRI
ncbi:hypothetical protein HY504_00690 [Candidatus Wolfebacteria bacterium]|nr:hypothetical protein [Candidatus Wolfebacteria bacterium]